MNPRPPPPVSRRYLELQMNRNNPMAADSNNSPSPPPATDANRLAPPPTKQRRMSSRELMQMQAATTGRHTQSHKSSASQPNVSPQAPPQPPASSRASSVGTQGVALPQHPNVQMNVSDNERKKNYRRGSITERYRRASIFNEIIKEQQKKSSMESNMENGNGNEGATGNDPPQHSKHSSMTDAIQNTQNYGINTQHRSRIMAFEQAYGTDDDFIINPYCVASMPEPIRKAFVIKVCGIVLSQMLLMVTVICIIKYSGLGAEIIKGYNLWSLLTTFIPLIFLAILMGVRKKHPWNLLVFSLFTLSWAYSLGIACVWLENRLFISVMGLTAMNTLGIMGFARFVSYDRFNCCNCSMVVGFLSFITIFISYGIYPEEPWGNHIWPAFISLIFGSWICWDLKALQIDLTADEYIIGAVDLYLDILNMVSVVYFCCLLFFEIGNLFLTPRLH